MAHQNEELQNCIEVCQACHNVCLETITYCLTTGGKHAAPEHIRTLIDCAQICDTSADFMLRGSALHPQICRVCAEVCERCAESCEQVGGLEMKRCADECRRCADECRAMSQALS